MREVVLLVISQQHFPHTFEYFPIDTWLHSKALSQEGLKTALKTIDLTQDKHVLCVLSQERNVKEFLKKKM